MKCPTCGRYVPRNQDVCPFCGGMVSFDTSFEKGGPTFSPATITPQPAPQFSSRPTVFEEVSPADSATPAPPPPIAKPPRPAARSPLQSFIRFFMIVIFLLVPLFNFLSRNFERLRQASREPVIRQALF